MRRFATLVLPLLLVALACVASASFAQSSPNPTTGGVVITLSPEDGAPVTASVPRSLMRGQLVAARQWMIGFASPVLPAAGRPSFKARRAGVRRTPIWVP